MVRDISSSKGRTVYRYVPLVKYSGYRIRLYVQGIEKPQLIWQALPQRLAGRVFPVAHNRVSDRQGFLSEIGSNGTARRGPRGGTQSAAGSRSFCGNEGGGRLLSFG